MKISFPEQHKLNELSIRLVPEGMKGIYFVFLKSLRVAYPFKASRLVYIGMSEARQNSIRNRLRGHLTGQSGNLGIANYAKKHEVLFSYQPKEVLSVLGTENLFEHESFFLSDFAAGYGCYPVCNGQAGVSFPESKLRTCGVEVAWSEFE